MKYDILITIYLRIPKNYSQEAFKSFHSVEELTEL